MRSDPLRAACGDLLEFEYPERNLIGVPATWRRRVILVEFVHDMVVTPIDPRAVELRPLIRRGRHLVVGYDLDAGRSRSFYREAMRHVRRPSWLQLALFDPCEEEPRLRRPRGPFAPTAKDRLFLAEVIRHYNRITAQRDDIWLNLGVFPWEPRHGHQGRHPTQAGP